LAHALLVGCGAGGADKPESEPAAFVDQKKQVPPGREWHREVRTDKAGRVTFRISSHGPLGVTVVADRSFKAMAAGKREAVRPEDLVFAIDTPGPTYTSVIRLPAGSSWFMIENRSDRTAEIRLECFRN
jgi:hypothetical protein